MAKPSADLVSMLRERDAAARTHHEMRTGRDMPNPFTIEGMAADEIMHLRDCLGSIRAHLVGQDSALAVAIRATCNSGLRETSN